MLLGMDDILILAHENPDGDAVGSSTALCLGLRALGKNAFVSLESVSRIDAELTFGLTRPDGFVPEHIVAVDTADVKILGVKDSGTDKNCRVELCVDHHVSNVFFAENTYLDDSAAAAAEAVYDILNILGVTVDKEIAKRIYVGVATDTGCFRYGNTTAKSHRIAADMADTGIDIAGINKIQFETKSKEYAEMEKMAIASMKSYFGGKCAMITVTHDMYVKSGVPDSETQQLSAVPRQIEGVLVGLTLKEKQEKLFRISVRTNEPADASKIAQMLGGGGHKNAAGCSVSGTLEEAVSAVLDCTKKYLTQEGLI